MKKGKALEKLTVRGVIKLLKKSPKKLRKTPHTRIGLIAWLYVLYTKAFTACDRKVRRTQAGDYLEWLRNNGSDDEKILLTGLHVAE